MSHENVKLSNVEFRFMIKEILHKIKMSSSKTEESISPTLHKASELIADEIDQSYKFQKKGETLISAKQISRHLKMFYENKEPTPIKRKSLNAYAILLGYESYKQYYDKREELHFSDKVLFNPLDIKVKKLKKGVIVHLGWIPEYGMDVEYLGQYKFEVKKTYGYFDFAKEVGDEFVAKSFYLQYVYSLNKDNDGYPLHPLICISQEENAQNIFTGI